jgi:hypothetical protein
MLHNRTGVEALLVLSRSDRSQFTRPHTWSTSQSVEDFFQLSYEETPDDFAGRLESYKLAGVEGMQNQSISIIKLIISKSNRGKAVCK